MDIVDRVIRGDISEIKILNKILLFLTLNLY